MDEYLNYKGKNDEISDLDTIYTNCWDTFQKYALPTNGRGNRRWEDVSKSTKNGFCAVVDKAINHGRLLEKRKNRRKICTHM